WRLDPELIEARVARGWGKLTRNKGSDVAESESDFRAVNDVGLKRGVRFLYGSFGYAEVLRLRGEYSRAIEEYTALVPYEFREDAVFAGLGFCHYATARWQEAVEGLTSALDINPDYPSARLCRADAFGCLGSFDQAIEDCKMII